MSQQKVQILSSQKVEQKITRIAYEIVEHNFDEEELAVIGIKHNGYELAQQLSQLVEDIGSMTVTTGAITMNKKKPVEEEIDLDLDITALDDKVVVLVDDVTNTGRTLMYALSPFHQIVPKKLSTAVLVDRQHKAFPVSPDYVGLSLATTMQEHISVELGEQPAAYLT
jgi:pyrimidine operon attenuation protein/uracil phosphoribosyltransferase